MEGLQPGVGAPGLEDLPMRCSNKIALLAILALGLTGAVGCHSPMAQPGAAPDTKQRANANPFPDAPRMVGEDAWRE